MREDAIIEVGRRHAGPVSLDTAAVMFSRRSNYMLERWARHEVDLPETYPTGV